MVNEEQKHSVIIGSVAAVMVVFFWSGWIVVSRFGVTNSLTVYDIAGLRFSIGALAILPYMIWSRAWRGLTPKRVLVLTFTSGIPYALLSYFGFSLAPAAHGGVFLNGCLPLFTALFGWIWLGQRSRPSQMLGLGIILVGVILVSNEGFGIPGSEKAWLGDFFFLAAIALFALFMIANRLWSITPAQVLFSATLVSALIYVPFWVLLLESNMAGAPSSEILLQAGYQGLVPSVMGMTCLNIAIRNIGARTTSLFLSAVPVLAALAAIPILLEIPGPRAWAGMLLVSFGILLAMGLMERKKALP